MSISPLVGQHNALLVDYSQNTASNKNGNILSTLKYLSNVSIDTLNFSFRIEKPLAWKETNYGQVIAAVTTGIIITCLLLLSARTIKERLQIYSVVIWRSRTL